MLSLTTPGENGGNNYLLANFFQFILFIQGCFLISSTPLYPKRLSLFRFKSRFTKSMQSKLQSSGKSSSTILA